MNNREIYNAIEEAKNVLIKDRTTDWRKIHNNEVILEKNSCTKIILEICPEFTNLEEIDSADLLEAYNDYYGFNAAGSEDDIDWTKKDIKIRLLDYDNLIGETLDVIYFDDNDVLTSLSDYQKGLLKKKF